MITVLIPTYREGTLLASCIRSVCVPGVEHIAVFEGPVGGAEPSTDDNLPFIAGGYTFWETSFHSELGQWEDDAEKRSVMLAYAKNRHEELPAKDNEPLWIFWLDGDEVLIFGEYLNDWVLRAEKNTGAGGFALRLVELDGSVSKTHNRIIRGDLISHYIHSIMTVQLASGLTVSLPNVQICTAGGIPVWDAEKEGRPIQAEDCADLRPPVAGEPHILHRSILRDPNRSAVRQSEAEADWFAEQGRGIS